MATNEDSVHMFNGATTALRGVNTSLSMVIGSFEEMARISVIALM